LGSGGVGELVSLVAGRGQLAWADQLLSDDQMLNCVIRQLITASETTSFCSFLLLFLLDDSACCACSQRPVTATVQQINAIMKEKTVTIDDSHLSTLSRL
jgi:hypothetical protein